MVYYSQPKTVLNIDANKTSVCRKKCYFLVDKLKGDKYDCTFYRDRRYFSLLLFSVY